MKLARIDQNTSYQALAQNPGSDGGLGSWLETEAWRRAKMSQDEKPFASIYFWGAFTVTGDL